MTIRHWIHIGEVLIKILILSMMNGFWVMLLPVIGSCSIFTMTIAIGGHDLGIVTVTLELRDHQPWPELWETHRDALVAAIKYAKGQKKHP